MIVIVRSSTLEPTCLFRKAEADEKVFEFIIERDIVYRDALGRHGDSSPTRKGDGNLRERSGGLRALPRPLSIANVVGSHYNLLLVQREDLFRLLVRVASWKD